MFDDTDPTKVVRNTQTLDAYRARRAAAQRAGTPFLLLPALLNPAIYIPALRSFLPAIHGWTIPAILVLWLALTCASLCLGLYCIRRYLRDHPLIGDLEGTRAINVKRW